MVPEKPERSQVVPLLVAALVCDVAVQDPATGKKNLIGIFDKIHIEKFPSGRPMSLYLKLADAEGYYEIEVKYVQVNTGKILAKVPGNMRASDRLASLDVCVQLSVPIPEPGRYEFQVWMNSAFLGSTFIDAVQRNPA